MSAHSPGRSLLGFAAIALLACASCQIEGGRPRIARLRGLSDEQQMSVQALKQNLAAFEQRALAAVSNSSNRIQRESDGPARGRDALVWRIRFGRELDRSLDNLIPLIAFLDAWCLCVQMEDYFIDGLGRDLFGDSQQIAIDTSSKLVSEMRQIGATFLDPEQLAQAEEDVLAFANEYQLGAGFSRPVILTQEDDVVARGRLTWVTDLTLAPFRAIGAFGNTPDAVRDVANAAVLMSDVVKELPEQTRLQTELLLFDVEERHTVTEALARMQELTEETHRAVTSFADFTEVADRAVTVADELPDRLRTEVSATLDQIDAKQENLQETLRIVDTTLASVDPALDKAQDTLKAAEATVQALTDASRAVEGTAVAIGKWVIGRDPDGELPPKPAPDPDARPFDITEYTATANAISAAALELTALVQEFAQASSPERLEQTAEGVSTVARSTLTDARGELEGVIDHLFSRAVQLVLLIFGGLIVYRVVAGVIGRKLAG